ncbi:purine-cytosine permease family protein [Acidiphilium iwatense]|uniref:Cytosine permease n=1 Tax=Acidiphilium iwatense TaxID=768198 RepID=A0ABS9DTQ6_9PROT|nr:cytosine permease [Acidiphilium iwatense]MCF3945160.1 cytosine permease [Acidiphilium iwatense]
MQETVHHIAGRPSPTASRSNLVEAHSIDYIPLKERHGKVWHLWPVWFTGDAHLATLATGVLGLSMGANLIWTIIAIVLGCAFGTFFMAFHSTQGPQLGLPQMIQSRPQFGYMGALLVWIIALVCYIGFNAFNQLLAGQTIHQLTAVNTKLSFSVFTIVSIVIAIIGYDWIHRAQRLISFIMIAVLVVFTVGVSAYAGFPGHAFDLASFQSIPFLAEFFAAAAYQLSWAIYVSDYSRYLPPDVGVRASFWWTYLGALIGGAWMMIVGALAAALAPKVDVAQAVLHAGNLIFPGFGVIVLVASFLGLITITGLNFYGGSLTLLSAVDSFKPVKTSVKTRIISVLAVAVAATAIAFMASGNFMTGFGNFLTILLYLFTPWTAINLVDFYFVRHGMYSIREIFNPKGMYGRWNWRGLVAYAIGFVVMIPFFSTGIYTGPIAHMLGGADISMLVGLPVSTIVYLLACRSLNLAGERRLVERADASLEPVVAKRSHAPAMADAK